MKIRTQKTGGIWHGYLEGHPEVDERALTEDIARQKVERIVARLAREPEGQDGEIGQQDRNDPVIAIEEHLTKLTSRGSQLQLSRPILG